MTRWRDGTQAARVTAPGLLALTLVMATAGPAASASVVDFVRVRCSTDGADVYFTWSGSVHALEPAGPPRPLFDLTGFSVARCDKRPDGAWSFTSREVMLYIDPATGGRLDRWRNPWTGADVPVVHVANSPVQGTLRAAPHLLVAGELATFALDVFPSYPNPLYARPETRRFSPQRDYRASESFTFTVPAGRLRERSAAVREVALSWHRTGPWLPWMAMGDRPGVLVYAARGRRHGRFDALPEVLRREVDARLPLYRRAPPCLLDRPNQTSWTYFGEHLAAYLRGDRFPLPAPADAEERCAR